jgi:hypothetical protein
LGHGFGFGFLFTLFCLQARCRGSLSMPLVAIRKKAANPRLTSAIKNISSHFSFPTVSLTTSQVKDYLNNRTTNSLIVVSNDGDHFQISLLRYHIVGKNSLHC